MAAAAPHSIGELSRDRPSEKDAFGAHAAIARAIKKLILESNRGFGVALVGEPGSGKSTVLTLLEGECGSDGGCGIRVFRFEAWAHEGDNLRRAFLEELADFLNREWKVDTKAVRDGLSPPSSSSAERITWPAFLLALGLFLLLTPGSALRAGLGLPAHGLEWLRWLRVVGVWASFFGMAVVASCVRSKEHGGLLSALARTATKSAATRAPTSLEFRKYFRDLLSAAGLKPGRRVLVIALEDFDRLPVRDREEAWSVMRTYAEALARTRDDQEEWKDAVWTIVPLKARSAERPVMAPLAESSLVESAQRIVVAREKSGTPERADRLCQIEFAVPPPLLTRWRGFLSERLREQLPGWSDEDRSNAVSVYAARLAYKPLGSSPRRLRAFVNELVALNALSAAGREVMPGAVIQLAVNVIAADGVVEPETLIQTRQAGSGADVEEVASLLYNREGGEAVVAALGEPVIEALRSGDRKRLAQLNERCGAVPLVAQTMVEREVDTWAEGEAQAIGHAAFALALKPGVLEGRAGWLLKDGALKVKLWWTLDATAGEGMGWLCRAQRDSAHLIFESVARTVDLAGAPADFERCCIAIDKLVTVAADVFPASLPIGESAAGFLRFASTLHASSPALDLARYRPGCGQDALVSYLSAAPRDGDWVAGVSAAALAGIEMGWLIAPARTHLLGAASDNSLARAAELAAVVTVVGRAHAPEHPINLVQKVCGASHRVFALLTVAHGQPLIERAIVLGVLMSQVTLLGPGAKGLNAAGRFGELVGGGPGPELDAIVQLARDAGAKAFLEGAATTTPTGPQRDLINYILDRLP